MANPEHVAVVKKGAKAIEKWRLRNKGAMLELIDANLVKAKLSGANFEKAIFSRADLAYADFSKANLAKADLAFSLLLETNFSEANLSRTRLSFAYALFPNLSHSNLSRSDLTGLMLRYPTVKSKPVNLKNAIMGSTVLVSCDMNDFDNVETVKHKGPSNIDINTLILSYSNSKDFETKLEPFFLDAGVPKSLLASLPEIVAGIAYCNCFVCYGEPDRAFAEKLVKDLSDIGIRCWIYSMDATPGKKIWKEINQARREADRMIVLCSIESLIRDGVKKEIEEQLDEEPEKMIPISLDDSWKEEGFPVMRGKRDLKHDLIDCTYADFDHPSKYKASFRRLLKALKKSKTKS